jgi:hypothetical protein
MWVSSSTFDSSELTRVRAIGRTRDAQKGSLRYHLLIPKVGKRQQRNGRGV